VSDITRLTINFPLPILLQGVWAFASATTKRNHSQWQDQVCSNRHLIYTIPVRF